jgi:hypothetical protein
MGMETLIVALALVHPSATTQGHVDYGGLLAHVKVLWWATRNDGGAPLDSPEK